MLRWPIAAKEPSAIEAIEMKTMICCHCAEDAGEGVDEDAHGHAPSPAIFGAAAKNAVTGVGAPS